MNQEYFYFVSGLPTLNFDDTKLSYTPEQFRNEASKQLTEKDYQSLCSLHLLSDIDNLLHKLYNTNSEPNPEGLINSDYWDEFIAFMRTKAENPNSEVPACFADLPPFILADLQEAMSRDELPPLASLEKQLIASFYNWAEQHPASFIKKWFAFDRQIRNILLAINGRKHQLGYDQYLVGHGEMIDHLAKSHAADFGIGKDNEIFESLYRIYEQNNLLYREKNYDNLRWKWIDNQNFFNYFNIDRVLGYYCKLRILNRWINADPNVGKEIFHDTLNAMENSFQFPDEFNIKSVRK